MYSVPVCRRHLTDAEGKSGQRGHPASESGSCWRQQVVAEENNRLLIR